MDITSTTVPQVPEFLNYLFTVKNLKPATITGYRTAIADALGSQDELISKSLELHRDRPKPNMSIPTWDLSLVLLGLTKPPFEPLSEAPLKWLTYKTVFLLALASGKRVKYMLGLILLSLQGEIGQKSLFLLQHSWPKPVGFGWP